MKPINLRTLYGANHVVRFEQSRTNERDAWLYIIPAKYGSHFYPHSATEIGVSVDGHPKLANKLARIPGVRVHQAGDDGTNLVFQPAQFNAVARVMKPLRRRVRKKSIS